VSACEMRERDNEKSSSSPISSRRSGEREREREKRREKKSEFSFRTPRRMLSRKRFKGVSRSALPLWLH
jgi:hypothetical protein